MFVQNLKLAFVIFLSGIYAAAKAQQLVLPGDFPDPSIVKIDDDYWASATTSNWLPAFPLLKSKDLRTWEHMSFVFTRQPDWADYYFWAPEISYDKGKVYVYYSAHKKNGNLCVGVASADKPEGPYQDLGPLICQEAGSIDAFPFRDDDGKLYLIWKEDLNSVGKPTPIWISEINEERTALLGKKKELFRNNKPWEGNLVEGVSILKNGEYFYAIYAASACCGKDCNYATGVARSKSLLGPWEKYSKNPLLSSSEKWKCPGHGTTIEKDGKYYFLHHAYSTKDGAFAGRQGIITEFRFTDAGWIEFVRDEVPSEANLRARVEENFSGKTLASTWSWSVFQQPKYQQKGGNLQLSGNPGESGSFLGQKILSSNFVAEAEVALKESNAEAGVAAIGDEKNIIYAAAKGNLLSVRVVKDDKPIFLVERSFRPTKKLFIRMEVFNGKEICFSYSNDRKTYTRLTDENVPCSWLPPWDRAVRAGILARGDIRTSATFKSFLLQNN